MTIAITEYSAAGEMLTDEIVRCDELVSAGVYKGYLSNTTSSSINVTSGAVGIYTAASQAGVRQTVQLSGSPGVNTVVVDVDSGTILADSIVDLWVSYVGFGPIKHNFQQVGINVPEALGYGSLVSVREFTFPRILKLASYSLNFYGTLPDNPILLSITNGTESVSISLDTSTRQYSDWFTSILKTTTSETLEITVSDGANAQGFELLLFDI